KELDKKIFKKELLQKSLINLRILKYPKVLFKLINEEIKEKIFSVFVEKLDQRKSRYIFILKGKNFSSIRDKIKKHMENKKLKKFSLDVKFSFLSYNKFKKQHKGKMLFYYNLNTPYKYYSKGEIEELESEITKPSIISTLEANFSQETDKIENKVKYIQLEKTNFKKPVKFYYKR
ncbi:MAG: hypothetical protein ACOCRX_01635, partial [Candidatus Woesearchaeota archaeon]